MSHMTTKTQRSVTIHVHACKHNRQWSILNHAQKHPLLLFGLCVASTHGCLHGVTMVSEGGGGGLTYIREARLPGTFHIWACSSACLRRWRTSGGQLPTVGSLSLCRGRGRGPGQWWCPADQHWWAGRSEKGERRR